MGRIKWIKWDADAALNGFFELSLEERGAYITVLNLIYARGGQVPDDDRYLSGCCRCDIRVWKRLKKRLLQTDKISIENGLVRNFRATSAILEALTFQEAQSTKGIKSGVVRRQNSKLARTPVEPEPQPTTTTTTTTEEKTLVAVGDVPQRSNGLQVKDAFDNWNTIAARHDLPIAQKLTNDRRTKLRARLSEHGLAGWNQALRRLEDSDFLVGKGPRGWRASLDFMLQPASFNKVLEGAYQNDSEH